MPKRIKWKNLALFFWGWCKSTYPLAMRCHAAVLSSSGWIKLRFRFHGRPCCSFAAQAIDQFCLTSRDNPTRTYPPVWKSTEFLPLLSTSPIYKSKECYLKWNKAVYFQHLKRRILVLDQISFWRRSFVTAHKYWTIKCIYEICWRKFNFGY